MRNEVLVEERDMESAGRHDMEGGGRARRDSRVGNAWRVETRESL